MSIRTRVITFVLFSVLSVCCQSADNTITVSQEQILGNWALVEEVRRWDVDGTLEENRYTEDNQVDEYLEISNAQIKLYYRSPQIDLESGEPEDCAASVAFDYVLKGNRLDDNANTFQGTEDIVTESNAPLIDGGDSPEPVVEGSVDYGATVSIENSRLIMTWKEDASFVDGDSFTQEIELHYESVNTAVPDAEWPVTPCAVSDMELRPGARLRVH